MLHDKAAFELQLRRNTFCSMQTAEQTQVLKDERDELVAVIAKALDSSARVVTVGGKKLPIRVAKWMLEYRLPWELFWCDEHDQWFTYLDSSFPMFGDNCQCKDCIRSGGNKE